MALADRQEVIIYLFRRHYVQARNLLLDEGLPKRLIEDIIEKATIAVWFDLIQGLPKGVTTHQRFFEYIQNREKIRPPAHATEIEAAFQRLYRICDPMCMQLIVWSYAEGRSFENIGQLLGISSEEAEQRSRSCFRQLRRLIRDTQLDKVLMQ